MSAAEIMFVRTILKGIFHLNLRYVYFIHASRKDTKQRFAVLVLN